MKKSSLFGILIIAVAIGAIVSMSGDASSYVTFREASEMAANGASAKVHVVGKLKKDASGHVAGMVYNPSQDPNFFSFRLIDDSLRETEVVYLNPKPQDFESGEKIVVIGCMKNNTFVADKILLKCPSKYNEGKPDMSGTKASAE